MKKLLLFIIGIALFGTLIALTVFLTANRPAQDSIKALSNGHMATVICQNATGRVNTKQI